MNYSAEPLIPTLIVHDILESETDVVFFDTETTGLPDWGKPSEDECQPHLVELAALRFTVDGKLLNSMSVLVKPEGWVISDDTIAIHGITNEMAACGHSEKYAIEYFMDFSKGCGIRVAQNLAFDNRILRIALMRNLGEDEASAFKALKGECTALMAKPLLKLPATEAMKKTNLKNTFKTPNLHESLKYFTGAEHEGAHRALADSIACARVYFAIKGVQMHDFPDDLDYRERLSKKEAIKSVYLSGPMTGIADFNKPAFNAEAKRLRELGYTVLNPAENAEPQNPTWENWMRLAVAQLVKCDTIAMLPGWTESRGAIIERNLAKDLGFNIVNSRALF